MEDLVDHEENVSEIIRCQLTTADERLEKICQEVFGENENPTIYSRRTSRRFSQE